MTAEVDVPGAAPARRGITVKLLRSARGALSSATLAVIVLACVLAPVLVPYGALDQDLVAAARGPSAAHLLGTDSLGRDVLSRLLDGGTASLLGVLIAVAVRLVIAVPIGVLSGYLGGTTDRIVTRVTDLMMSIPVIVILLAVLAIFANSLTAAMVTLGVLGSFGLIRIVRGAALSVRGELYVSAARLMGLSAWFIMARHVLPRCRGVIIVQTALFAAIALGVQTGLTFLGLGPPPPEPTWGGMVAEAASVVQRFPWLLVPTGGILAVTVIALGVLGDVVRDVTAEVHTSSGGRTARRSTELPARPAAPDPGRPRPGALLVVEELSVTFEGATGPVTVLDGVRFDVRPGETVGLVGESGSGKSVAAKAVLGLLPRNGRITAGRVEFDGQDLTTAHPGQLRRIRGRRIGLVAQDPMNALDPTCRVGAHLTELIQAHGSAGRRAARARALELLRLVRIPEPETAFRKYPHQVSGGMAQRVAIAMALSGRPDLLIADEPTTALDVTVQAEILDLLRDLQRETGMAVLLVTHDWGVVADLCSRVVVMYAGQVLERADAATVFRDPAHPYTRALLNSSPTRSPVGQRLRALEGNVPAPAEWPTGCHFAARCPRVEDDCRRAPIPLLVGPDGTGVRCPHSQLVASGEQEGSGQR